MRDYITPYVNLAILTSDKSISQHAKKSRPYPFVLSYNSFMITDTAFVHWNLHILQHALESKIFYSLVQLLKGLKLIKSPLKTS